MISYNPCKYGILYHVGTEILVSYLIHVKILCIWSDCKWILCYELFLSYQTTDLNNYCSEFGQLKSAIDEWFGVCFKINRDKLNQHNVRNYLTWISMKNTWNLTLLYGFSLDVATIYCDHLMKEINFLVRLKYDKCLMLFLNKRNAVFLLTLNIISTDIFSFFCCNKLNNYIHIYEVKLKRRRAYLIKRYFAFLHLLIKLIFLCCKRY